MIVYTVSCGKRAAETQQKPGVQGASKGRAGREAIRHHGNATRRREHWKKIRNNR